jgi:hypothetical protein
VSILYCLFHESIVSLQPRPGSSRINLRISRRLSTSVTLTGMQYSDELLPSCLVVVLYGHLRHRGWPTCSSNANARSRQNPQRRWPNRSVFTRRSHEG